MVASTAAYAAPSLGVDYPYVLRMVELDGQATNVALETGASVSTAVQTNLMGERIGDLTSTPQVELTPFGIATVMLDLIEGRKQVRDLDAKRKTWATVHRTEA